MGSTGNGYLAFVLIVLGLLVFVAHVVHSISMVNVFSDPRLNYNPLKRDEDLANASNIES